jgi:hypothetical protein
VAERTTVRSADEDAGGCTVSLGGGARITAEQVVVATQGPVVDPGLLANRCTPVQSYALAAGLSGPVPSGLYLSCDRAVRSLRPAVTQEGARAVIGGEGHPMGEGEAGPGRRDALAAWTAEHFGAAEVTHAVQGPTIAPLPGR